MSDPTIDKIQRHPKYQELRSKRNGFGVMLTVLILVAYYGYIGLIAFDKTVLGQPTGSGVTTLGVPVGIGLILFTIALTGIYVARANSDFDKINHDLLKDVNK